MAIRAEHEPPRVESIVGEPPKQMGNQADRVLAGNPSENVPRRLVRWPQNDLHFGFRKFRDHARAMARHVQKIVVGRISQVGWSKQEPRGHIPRCVLRASPVTICNLAANPPEGAT